MLDRHALGPLDEDSPTTEQPLPIKVQKLANSDSDLQGFKIFTASLAKEAGRLRCGLQPTCPV